MAYLVNSKLEPGATPYRITSTATVDTTQIWDEELDRLAKNSPDGLLPIAVATHGAKNCADDVTRLLEEQGQERFTESQWRSALREVFRRLTDNKGDIRDRSPNLAHRKDHLTLTSNYEPSAEDVRLAAAEFDNRVDRVDNDSARIHARATEILRASGVWKPSADEYVEAANRAKLELSPDEPENLRGYSNDESLELHVAATKILRAKGVYREDETEELYASALAEAESIMAIDLRGER